MMEHHLEHIQGKFDCFTTVKDIKGNKLTWVYEGCQKLQ